MTLRPSELIRLLVLLLATQLPTPVEAQERIVLGTYGVSVPLPEDWEAAPDTLLNLLNERARLGPEPSEIVALLSPIGAEEWTAYPYVLIAVDTVQPFATLDDLETYVDELIEASMQGRSPLPGLEQGLSDPRVGIPVYDPGMTTLWMVIEATRPDG